MLHFIVHLPPEAGPAPDELGIGERLEGDQHGQHSDPSPTPGAHSRREVQQAHFGRLRGATHATVGPAQGAQPE